MTELFTLHSIYPQHVGGNTVLIDCINWLQHGFKMFLGITPVVTNWSPAGDEFSLLIENSPLIDFVELPEGHNQLNYSNILCGALRGALEMVSIALFLSVSSQFVFFCKAVVHSQWMNEWTNERMNEWISSTDLHYIIHIMQYIHHIHYTTYTHRPQIQSPSERICVVPRTHNSFSDRSFSAAGLRVWNVLLSYLQQDMNYKHFKHALKGHMFSL